MLPLIISCTRSWNFARHLLSRSTTEGKNVVKLLAISQTIHTKCAATVCFTQCTLFFKKFVSIENLFVILYLWGVCIDDKCCVVTQRAAVIRVDWIVYLACLRSHVLRAYCNFE